MIRSKVRPLGTGLPKKKQSGCKGCPLEVIGKGFVCPSVPDWNKIRMVVQGEAPGANEVIEGKAFIGKAGWWLENNILGPAGLIREEVYFDNTLRCMPPKNKGGEYYPVGADKTKAELHCRKYDKAIPTGVPVLLAGGKAIGQRLGLPNVSDWHGHVVQDAGRIVGCTFHPSAVMRQPNLLPLVVREVYNLLLAHNDPSILTHPGVVKGWLKEQAGPMVFDLEWKRSDRCLGYCPHVSVVGVSYEKDKAYSTFDVETGRRTVRQHYDSGGRIIGHNIIDADLPRLGMDNIHVGPDSVFDTKIVGHLIHSHFAAMGLLSLRSLISYYRPITGWKEDKDSILEYNGRDCAYNFSLYESLCQDLDATDQWHLVEKQQRLAQMSVKMRQKGVALDKKGIKKWHRGWKDRKLSLKSKFPFNPNSPKQIIEFFKVGGIKLTSTKEKYLSRQRRKHEMLDKLVQYKEVGVKPITTWFPLDTDIVHPTFSVTGTDVARFSSSEPNFQNIPPELRGFIVPRSEDLVIVGVDASQIENRCIAYLADDKAMLNDFASGMDFHKLSASRIYDKEFRDVTDDERYEGKKTIHATNYKETAGNLSERLFGDKTKENLKKAVWLQEAYFKAYPGIKEWQDGVSEGLETGEIMLRNPFGRVRFIYAQDAHSRAKKGCHFLGCSTGADIVNQRALDVWQELGMLPLMMVHDELVYEVRRDEVDVVTGKLKAIMERPVKELGGMRIPAKVKIGESYGFTGD